MSGFITKEQLTKILKDLQFDGDTHCHCEDYCTCYNRLEVDYDRLDDAIKRHTEEDEVGYNLYSVRYVKSLENTIKRLEYSLEADKEGIRESISKDLTTSYEIHLKRLKEDKAELQSKIKRVERGVGMSIDIFLDKMFEMSLREKDAYFAELLKDLGADD